MYRINLEVLFLNKNKNIVIPGTFENLKKMNTIKISKNDLKQISILINKLDSLKRIELDQFFYPKKIGTEALISNHSSFSFFLFSIT